MKINFFYRILSQIMAIGFKNAWLQIYRYLSVQIRSRFPSGQQTVQTDHPQFTDWIRCCESQNNQLADQKTQAEKFAYKPLISVIIPVFRVPREILLKTLGSLEDQSYSNWQACVVWADPDNVEGWRWLQEKASVDKRYKIKCLAQNGGISRNSNVALEMAEGDYVALLDHDDVLSPWAFFEVVKLLQSFPELEFMYSDRDLISENGYIRLNPFFKPGWSPQMLHSVNFLVHMSVIRANLIRQVGGWRQEVDGAQDWDLFFRITERTKNIARIPSVLYHWRKLSTSLSRDVRTASSMALAQLRIQQDYFKSKGLPAKVLPSPEGLFHIKWPPKPASVDVIIYQNGSLFQLNKILGMLTRGQSVIIRHIYVLMNALTKTPEEDFYRKWRERCFFLYSDVVNWKAALMSANLRNDDQTVLLLDGKISGISDDLAEELAGWVIRHPNIAWVSAVAMNKNGMVYEAGRVVSKDLQSAPMFYGNYISSIGWFGKACWYRNAQAASPYGMAINAINLRAALSQLTGQPRPADNFSEFCLTLSSGSRWGLINPFARVFFQQPPETHWPNDGQLYKNDPYFNPAFWRVGPLMLQPSKRSAGR